ncbi:MAG: hypothetical protein PUF07_00110, partial [Bacteroidales bacterium]|nr:hypothetical protein [Bacteroidales bacterium]
QDVFRLASASFYAMQDAACSKQDVFRLASASFYAMQDAVCSMQDVFRLASASFYAMQDAVCSKPHAAAAWKHAVAAPCLLGRRQGETVAC